MKNDKRDNPQPYRIYDPDGIAPCMNTMGGGGREPHIIEEAKYPSGNQKSGIFGVGGVARTLAATDYKQPVSVVLPLPEILTPPRKKQQGAKQSEGLNPTLTTNKGEGNG